MNGKPNSKPKYRASIDGPTAIDKHVGMHIRLARMAKGMSQEKIADELGLTFQQIQKYEKGTNRTPVANLMVIAKITERPLMWFIPDAPGDVDPIADVGDDVFTSLIRTGDGVRMAELWPRLDRETRGHLIGLVQRIAEAGETQTNGQAVRRKAQEIAASLL